MPPTCMPHWPTPRGGNVCRASSTVWTVGYSLDANRPLSYDDDDDHDEDEIQHILTVYITFSL